MGSASRSSVVVGGGGTGFLYFSFSFSAAVVYICYNCCWRWRNTPAAQLRPWWEAAEPRRGPPRRRRKRAAREGSSGGGGAASGGRGAAGVHRLGCLHSREEEEDDLSLRTCGRKVQDLRCRQDAARVFRERSIGVACDGAGTMAPTVRIFSFCGIELEEEEALR